MEDDVGRHTLLPGTPEPPGAQGLPQGQIGAAERPTPGALAAALRSGVPA